MESGRKGFPACALHGEQVAPTDTPTCCRVGLPSEMWRLKASDNSYSESNSLRGRPFPRADRKDSRLRDGTEPHEASGTHRANAAPRRRPASVLGSLAAEEMTADQADEVHVGRNTPGLGPVVLQGTEPTPY